MIPIPRKSLLAFIFTALSVVTVFVKYFSIKKFENLKTYSFYQMYKKVKDKFQDALKNASFFTYLILSITFVYFCSPSNVGERQIRTLIYLLGINFGKLVVSLTFFYLFLKKIRLIYKSLMFQIPNLTNSEELPSLFSLV